MKLLSITLDGEYKGLTSQTYDFSQSESDILALIGLNGSGKSHLLELICESFAWLERATRDDFRTRHPLPYSVELRYLIHIDLTFIEEMGCDFNDQTQIRVRIDELGQIFSNALASDGQYYRTITKLPLPKYIVGYASGLNENLQRSFMKNAVQYVDVMATRARRRKELTGKLDFKDIETINRKFEKRYRGVFEKDDQDFQSLKENDTELPSLRFLDYDCNALLVACMSILPEEQFDYLFPQVEHHRPQRVQIRYDLRRTPATEDSIRDIEQLIRVVGNGAVMGIGESTSDKEFELYSLDYLTAVINLDFTRQGLRERLEEAYYGKPLVLFEKLYKIQLLGAQKWQGSDKQKLRRDSFVGNVKKPLKTKLPLSVVSLVLSNSAGHTISYDDLSDGEAQLFQILSAVHMYSGEETLFVFDEPETHLNPLWRTYFHSYLSKAMPTLHDRRTTQAFVSTHSPFMISALRKNSVHVFERYHSRTLMINPSSETYGASFGVLIKKFFDLNTLISQTAVDEIKQKLAEGDDAAARTWIETSLGDSMEKAYLLRKLEE